MSDSVIPGTVAHQVPLSMGFSGKNTGEHSPFPHPGDLPNPGIEPRFHELQADSLLSEPPEKPLSRRANVITCPSVGKREAETVSG